MEPTTHFLAGACLARAGFNRKAAYATLAMTLAAETPDLDTLWSAAGPVAAFQHHRGITHTFLGLPFDGLVVLGVVWGIHRWRQRRAKSVPAPKPGSATDQPIERPLTAAPVRWGLLYGFILIALLSHILLDWTNNYGVRPFFPFNPHWYAGSFVFIFEPFLWLILLVALVAPALFGLIGSEVGARHQVFRGRGWAIFGLIAVVALWGWRKMEHDSAVQLASTATYGPEGSAGAEILRVTASPHPGNPFRWHTVVETPTFYQIAAVDSRKGTVVTVPEQDLFYKPADTPATLAAKQSWLGRVYLDWSAWPVVTDVGLSVPPGAPPDSPQWTTVSFRDLRFVYDTSLMNGRINAPLSATVYVDAQGQVEQMQMGSHVQH